MKNNSKNLLWLFFIAIFVLAGCSGGGGDGAGEAGEDTSLSPTSPNFNLIIGEVDNADSPIIAVATDGGGKEKIAIIGEKDAAGMPVKLTGAVFISDSGVSGLIEIGSDGLPTSLSDPSGSKITYTNYTDSTVEITVFDHYGNWLAGPIVVEIDSVMLSEVQANYAVLSQGVVSPNVNAVDMKLALMQGVTKRDMLIALVDGASVGISLAMCPVGILAATSAATVTAGMSTPLLVLAVASCGSDLLNAAGKISGMDFSNTGKFISLNDTYIIANKANCTRGLIILDLKQCIGLLFDKVKLAIEADFEAPTVPTGLSAILIKDDRISLMWNPSEDNILVDGYLIYRDDVMVKDVQGPYLLDLGVNPGQSYCYYVVAYDKLGNVSSESEGMCATTLAVPDTLFPSIPTGLTADFATPTQVNLFWNGSTDNVEVAGYKVYRNGIYIKSVATTFGSDPDLSPSTQYCYTVTAYDASDNESDQSATSCTTTLTSDILVPSVGSVWPYQIIGSNVAQPFSIYGSNFVSGANIILRDKSTGEVFPNLVASSFSSTQIVINPIFTTTAAIWSIEVTNPDGKSSGAFAFQVVAPAVSIPINLSPGSQASPGPTTSSSTVSLSWSLVNGATYYELGVRDMATGVLVINTTTSGTSYNASLVAGKQYRWNVAACNSAGCSSYTAVLYFQTPGDFAPTITSVSPNPVTGSTSPQWITLYGSGFQSGPSIYVTWTGGSTTLSSTQVVWVDSTYVLIYITTLEEADIWTAEVTNPDGQVSNTVSFNVI